jgi:hypothetical protein
MSLLVLLSWIKKKPKVELFIVFFYKLRKYHCISMIINEDEDDFFFLYMFLKMVCITCMFMKMT